MGSGVVEVVGGSRRRVRSSREGGRGLGWANENRSDATCPCALGFLVCLFSSFELPSLLYMSIARLFFLLYSLLSHDLMKPLSHPLFPLFSRQDVER